MLFPLRTLLLAALCLICSGLAAAGEIARIVAVVNNDAITSVQLDKALAGTPGTVTAEARGKMLDQLVEESLIRQRGAELGIQVTDEEVEAAVQDVQRQNKLTAEQLESALRQQGITPSEYRQTLRRQILRLKVLGKDAQNRTEVSSREIQEYYGQYGGEFREQPAVGLKRLSFSLPVPRSADSVQVQRARAETARRELLGGANVELVMTRYNVGGGEMGTFPLADLSPAFAAAVKDLPVGACSEVLETADELHILIVTSRTEGRQLPLDQVKGKIRERLVEQKRTAAVQAWLNDLRAKARIDLRP